MKEYLKRKIQAACGAAEIDLEGQKLQHLWKLWRLLRNKTLRHFVYNLFWVTDEINMRDRDTVAFLEQHEFVAVVDKKYFVSSFGGDIFYHNSMYDLVSYVITFQYVNYK